jgi:DNA-binding HxlR family transcriptional regulator
MASASVDNALGGSDARLEGAPDRRPAKVCPRYHAAVEMIGRRWTGAILVTLLDGPVYFRELGGAIPGVSDRLLSRRLRELETEGLVVRAVHDGPPARVSYSLTETGLALEPAIRELHRWAQGWGAANGVEPG